MVLGAGIVFLFQRPWQHAATDTVVDASSISSPSTGTTEPSEISPPVIEDNTPSGDVAPPTARSFKLPAVSAPIAQPRVKTESPPEGPVYVPKDWLLRGSGQQNYDLRIDRAEAFSGQTSVMLASHQKDVAATQFGSLMQSVIADPWLGQRVVFSASTKRESYLQYAVAWVRALDASGTVIAYNEMPIEPYRKTEWRRLSVAIDVPWSATEIAYGVNLHATGKLWVDGAKFSTLDGNTDVEARNLFGRLGVKAQETGQRSPLAAPANMDFEQVVPLDAGLRVLPKDAIDKARF